MAKGKTGKKKRKKKATTTAADILALWNNIDVSGGFSSLPYFIKALRKRGIDTPQKKVREILEDLPAYQTSRQVPKRFARRPTLAFYFSERWEADTGDIGKERYIDRRSGKEKGRFFFLACDIFSKRFFIEAVRSKGSSDALDAFKLIIQGLKPPYQIPNAIELDRGGEFGGRFRAFLKEKNIRLIHAHGNNKARIAERGIRSFKKVMIPFLEHAPADMTWERAVRLVCKNLNGRFNRSIGMSPNEVTHRWRDVQARNNKRDHFMPITDYLESQKRFSKGGAIRDDRRQFKLGQRVYVPYAKSLMDKESDRQYKYHVYTISQILNEHEPPLYRVVDENKKKQSRLYYARELRDVKSVPETYPVARILQRRTNKDGVKEVKIRWLDYDKEFDSWHPESYLTST